MFKQRKKLHVAAIVFLVFALVLSGCSPATPAAKDSDKGGEQAGPITATIISANVGGNMHVIAGALGKLVEEKVPGSRITVQPGESGGNPILIGNGEADIGTTMYSNATSAFDGRAPYKQAIKNVGVLANLNINQWITFITSNTKYSTLQEMIDAKHPMKLVLAKAGSSSEVLVRLILEGYGVTYDDIKSWGGSITHVAHADAVNLMKDNHADVYASIPSLRFPAVVDLTTSKDVKFLSLDKAIIDKVASENKLLTGTLPGGTYKGQDQDYYSLMETQLFIASTDKLSENDAYQITKILVEGKEKLVNAHSDMNTFDPSKASQNTGFPLHPGAEKYYKEAGLLK